MYIPTDFKENNFEEVLDFITHNPLGIIVSATAVLEPLVSHIPFSVKRIENDFILEGHLSIHNPHLDKLKKGKSALVIFQGPNAYVSSSVYSHTNVPTWNYQAVHLFGTVEILSRTALQEHLKTAVSTQEAHRHHQLSYDKFPAEMMEAYLNEIAGIRIHSYKIEAAFKMSQNRNETDYQNIVADLSQSNKFSDKEVANVMRKIRPQND